MSKIPGFRSNNTWKKILSIFLYSLVLLSYAVFISGNIGINDKIIWTLSLTLLYIPIFFISTNFLGIRDRLFSMDPTKVIEYKLKIFLSIFFSTIIGVVLFFIPQFFTTSDSDVSIDITSNNVLSTTEQIAAEKKSVILVEVKDGTGSGVIINKDGYAITNEHVVKGSKKCSIYFEDDQGDWGVKVDASVVFVDKKSDLAIIKLDQGDNYQIISLAEPDLIKVGQQVVAIGSPEGLINTVSEGIISGIRKIDGVAYLQTSVPITHGSSGGALLNRTGELVGITSSGLDANGNLNFAISVSDVISFLQKAQKDSNINILNESTK